jgi:hypothetical protein
LFINSTASQKATQIPQKFSAEFRHRDEVAFRLIFGLAHVGQQIKNHVLLPQRAMAPGGKFGSCALFLVYPVLFL